MPSTELEFVRLDVRELRIPFTTTFRHAAAERSETSSVWVKVETSDGWVGYGEGCPRPYVTGETIESAHAFVAEIRQAVLSSVLDAPTLRRWVIEHATLIDHNPAAWCAIELAMLDAIGRRSRASVEELLGLPPVTGTHSYTAVLGDADPGSFRALAQRYLQWGFLDFKVKLSGDVPRDRAKLAALWEGASGPVRIRADANNVWTSAADAITSLRALDVPLFAVEEPLPAGRFAELSAVSDAVGVPIVLDESLLRRDQIDRLDGPAGRWLINVRVSKMGGLLRSLDVVREAGARGIGVIVGAQVGETSLLTRAGLTIGQAAGPDLVAREGAFGTHLLTRDVVDPPLMFARGGALDAAAFGWLQSPGLGANVTPLP